MTDITERLRHIRRDGCLCADKPKKAALLHPICQEAADEIERLRAALDLVPDDIQLFRIMRAAGRSRRDYMLAINDALEPLRTALRGQG